MFRVASARHLALPLIFAALFGCQQHRQSGAPDSYLVDGVAWAFGSVQLTDVDAPGSIMLKRLPADQGVDGRRYRLFAAITAQANEAAAERELAYVDFHPTQSRLLAYNYQLDVSERQLSGSNQSKVAVDVFAVLRKAGRSYHGRQRVLLATAVFNAGADNTAVELADGLQLSLIANGVYAGQWALHYPKVPRVVQAPWQGQCPKSVVQSPGQNPSQNPSQFESCKPLPAQVDLCSGDPTKDGCRPQPPLQAPNQGRRAGDGAGEEPAVEGPVRVLRPVLNLEPVDDSSDVYIMPADAHDAKVTFVNPGVAVKDDAANAALCAKRFFAVARSVDAQENAACFVKPAPAEIKDGKLTCAVNIRFERAETYLEKVCNLTAVFRGDGGRKDSVQVLKR